MKKYIYLSVICCGALFTTGCEDFLTVTSSDQLTSDSFWRDQADAEAGLAAAYSQLEYYIDTWEFAEVKWPVEAYREDIINMGSDAMNYPNWVELYNFSYTNGNSQFSNYWANNYKGISFSNQVIQKVAGIPENAITTDIREQIVNEGHFLRGYYHLKLILNWEKIILRDKYITDPADLSKGLSSREEGWDFIISDFQKATQLPASHDADNVGRATRGAAYAYLGFAYLTRAYEETAERTQYLQKALEAFNEVKGYSLERNFASMFDATNKNCPESVFELQTSMNSANGANYRTQFHRWIGCAELWGWDEIMPSEILLDEFMKEGEIASTGLYDSRLYHTIFYQCDHFNDGNGRVFGYDYDEWFNYEDENGDYVAYNRPAFKKFLPATFEALGQNYCAINIPLMRYANVLLMKAEVLNEQGQTSAAIELINEIRDIHGDMPAMTGTSQEDVRAQIEHERMIEFPLENWRWYDLRRWGKLKPAMQNANRNGFDTNKHQFYPVPLTEINSNSQIKE